MKGRLAGLNLIAHMSGERGRCMMIQKNVHPSMNATCFTLDEEESRPRRWSNRGQSSALSLDFCEVIIASSIGLIYTLL